MRRAEDSGIGSVDGHVPLHALRNLQPDVFDSEPVLDVQQPESLPDDTPTQYVSESSSTFSAYTSRTVESGLTQRIFIDKDALNFEELPLKVIYGNRALPAFNKHKKFEKLLADDDTRIIIVAGPTGSGKSTQFPQFAVNAGYEVVKITQPRRAAADNVGDRIQLEIMKVAAEEPEMPQVAIRTGGKRDGPNDATITITTEGYLLTAWQSIQAEASTGKKIVLMLDEAHESSSEFEMLMVLSKKFLKDNPECKLKIVVMSATLDAEFIADYYKDLPGKKPEYIEVEGRMFDVTIFEKRNSTIVKEAIIAARKVLNNEDPEAHNGVLVFVPGKREIKDTIDEIYAQLPPDIARFATILPFHAKLSEDEQKAAHKHYPGVKIVVSTNASETSITDPDCAYVVDSGLARHMIRDEEQILGLERYYISQDECMQRLGRTGRTCPGTYVLTRLNETEEFVPFGFRNKSRIPEILRTEIVRHTLRTAAFGYDINLLTEIPDPIADEQLEQAKKILVMLGAFDENYAITELGRRMNEYPASAPSARMMVESERYNQMTRAQMSAIVACLEAGKLQLYAPDVEKRWQDLTEEDTSDLLAQLDIFVAIQGMTEAQMRDYDIDVNNYRRAVEQYYKIAKRSEGLVSSLELPKTTQDKENLVACILTGSLHSIYMNIGNGEFRHLGDQTTRREISNRSLVRSNPRVLVGVPYRAEYWRGGEKREKHIIENVTATTLAAIGRAAMHLSKWQHTRFTLRDNKVVSRREQNLFGEPLGVVEEAVVRTESENIAELKQYLFQYALDNPGPYQKKLRKIKTETESLAARAVGYVDQFTQRQLEELIMQAISDDMTDVTQIDNNIRLMIEELSLSLDTFIAPERRAEIRKNAPSELQIGENAYRVTYKSSGPELRIKTLPELSSLVAINHDILLPDGRPLKIVFQGKKYTLHEFQETFSKSK